MKKLLFVIGFMVIIFTARASDLGTISLGQIIFGGVIGLALMAVSVKEVSR